VSFAKKLLHLNKGGLIGALLTTLVGLLLYGGFGLGLIYRSYDYPFGPRRSITVDEVVLIYMDDESHRELNQPFEAPWDRSLHARLLDRLTREGCRAVVFDIVFADPSQNSATDERLASAIRANGKVVLAADAVPVIGSEKIGEAKRLIYPFEPFKENAAALGLDEVSASWKWKKMSAANAAKKLDEYVSLRGAIAHRGAAATAVTKLHATGFFSFVKRLVAKTGGKVNKHVMGATGKSLW